MSKPSDRQQWILQYLKDSGAHTHVDVLNEHFVSAYITHFKPTHRITTFGAYKCRQLGKDLSAMYKAGLLDRSHVGLAASNQLESDWPKWVYCYSLPTDGTEHDSKLTITKTKTWGSDEN